MAQCYKWWNSLGLNRRLLIMQNIRFCEKMNLERVLKQIWRMLLRPSIKNYRRLHAILNWNYSKQRMSLSNHHMLIIARLWKRMLLLLKILKILINAFYLTLFKMLIIHVLVYFKDLEFWNRKLWLLVMLCRVQLKFKAKIHTQRMALAILHIQSMHE